MKSIATTPRSNTENLSRNRSKVKFFLIGLLLIVGLPVIVLLVMYYQYQSAISKPLNASDEIVQFNIQSGESFQTIKNNLIDSEILDQKSARYFEIYMKQNSLGSKIQAGTFSIPKSLTIKEMAQTLQRAASTDIWVTLPEGLRADEYSQLLSEQLLESGNTAFDKVRFEALVVDEDFIESTSIISAEGTLEGYIFPDKYLVPIDATEEDLLLIFTETFKTKVSSSYTHEDIIIASLLEREGRSLEEKRMITDIIRRRLAEGWFINIDATLLYYHKEWKHVLTVGDLKLEHPYNTYVNLGLPPTPICNPSLQSIQAALTPIPNSYYYYIHDNSGNIHYARTWQEHSANVNLYLR